MPQSMQCNLLIIRKGEYQYQLWLTAKLKPTTMEKSKTNYFHIFKFIYMQKTKNIDIKNLLKKLLQKLENKTGKKVVLDIKIDDSIIGGGIVRINDDVIDGSIKRQMENIKNTF